MANYDGSVTSNPLLNDTYEGLWEVYHQPLLKRWVWTLGSVNALIVLGALATLLAFSQTRVWVIVRYLTHLRHRTVRLDGDDPDPLASLSQGQAIYDFMPLAINYAFRIKGLLQRFFRRQRLPRRAVQHERPLISPWFGALALSNLALFAILGVIIPLWLSDGALGAPIVRSRATTDCLDSNRKRENGKSWFRPPRTEDIFMLCSDPLHITCGSQYYLRTPQLSTRYSTECPFSDICQNGSRTLEITHSNISSLEVGVNSRSRLTMNHRIACAPVTLEPFLRLGTGVWQTPRISVGKEEAPPWFERWDNLHPMYMKITTENGPNSFSNESSGLRMAKKSGPYELMVLPKRWERPGSDMPGMREIHPDELHPDLRGEKRVSFLIVFRAGWSVYYNQVDDPFFQARQPTNPPSNATFFPDHEATALGCFEQYQYCYAKNGRCTSWGLGAEEDLKEVEQLAGADQASLVDFSKLI